MFFSTFKKVSSICQMWFMVHFYCIWYFAWGQSISLKLWLRNHDLKESKVFFSQSFFFMWNILYLKKGYNTLEFSETQRCINPTCFIGAVLCVLYVWPHHMNLLKSLRQQFHVVQKKEHLFLPLTLRKGKKSIFTPSDITHFDLKRKVKWATSEKVQDLMYHVETLGEEKRVH